MTDTARYVEIQVRSNEILQKFNADQDLVWERAGRPSLLGRLIKHD